MTERRQIIYTLLAIFALSFALAYLTRNVPLPPDCRFEPQRCEVQP